jgi:hypothetical protein
MKVTWQMLYDKILVMLNEPLEFSSLKPEAMTDQISRDKGFVLWTKTWVCFFDMDCHVMGARRNPHAQSKVKDIKRAVVFIVDIPPETFEEGFRTSGEFKSWYWGAPKPKTSDEVN